MEQDTTVSHTKVKIVFLQFQQHHLRVTFSPGILASHFLTRGERQRPIAEMLQSYVSSDSMYSLGKQNTAVFTKDKAGIKLAYTTTKQNGNGCCVCV